MSSFLISKYLGPENLSGFDRYKYSSIDNSPVSIYITHPFWNQCVKLCPLWLAPNLMTFVGFLFLVANFFILTYYDPHFLAASGGPPGAYYIPQWVWYFCAASQFLAHTLDGCDGKQARRTGSSTPLGELFDHGLDSWATLFMPLALFSVFGRDVSVSLSAYRFYFIVYGVFLQFYISHWEKYNTGVLFLPWGYDASQIALCLVYVLSAIWGYRLFLDPIFPFLPVSFPHLAEVLNVLFHLTTFGLTVPMSLYNLHHCWIKGELKQPSFIEGNKPWFPLLWLFTLTTIWATWSPTNIIDDHPRLFFWMMGAIFSNITCRLIVAQMSNCEAPVYNTLLIPLTVFVVAIFLPSGKHDNYSRLEKSCYILVIMSSVVVFSRNK